MNPPGSSAAAADLWLAVLWIALIAFGAMVAVCGLLGFRDIVSMLKTLQEEPDTLDESP